RVPIPNPTRAKGPVRNHSFLPTRRAQWSLPLLPADDLARVTEALRNRLLADARVLKEPKPQVFVQEWAADKRMLTVQAWTANADHQAVQQEMLEALGLTLEALRALAP